jgi:hypothetical protein
MVVNAKCTGLVLGAFLMLSGAGVARADGWNRGCEKKLQHEYRDLDRAVDRHGYYSRQAQEERNEIRRLENRCGVGRDDYRWRNFNRDRDDYRRDDDRYRDWRRDDDRDRD